MSRKTALWILLGLVIAGSALRSYHLTTRSLWFDESFSWRLIQFPVSEMIARTAADVHPPFYYVLLRAWAIVFGPSLMSLRSFSVAASALTIVAAYVFTSSAVRSRAAGVLAAALFATSGWQIAFAWEARMYTLGTALALLSSWLLLRATRRPSLTTWTYYAIVATLFAYTHYFSFFTLAAHASVVLGYLVIRSRGRFGEIIHSPLTWQAASAGAVIVLLYAPWIPVFLRQNQQVQASYWVPPPGGWSIPDTFYRFVLPTAQAPPHDWPAAVLTLIPMAITVLVWLILLLRPRYHVANWLVVASGLLPILAAVATAFLGQSLYQDRFLVFANIFVVVAAAMVIAGLRWTRVALVAGCLLPVILLAGFIRYWLELDIPQRPGVRGAVATLAVARQEKSAVVVSSPFIFFPVDYYVRAARQAPPKLLSETGEFSHFAGGPILTADDLITPDQISALPATHLWLVDTTGFGGRLTDPLPGWVLQQRQTFAEVFPHQGEVILSEYRRR